MPFDLTKSADWSTEIGLIRDMVEELGEELRFGFLDVTHTGEVEEIECQHRDGFIPFTNGGFSLWAYADFASARSSGSIPEAIKGMLERTLKDAAEHWLETEAAETYGYDPEGLDLPPEDATPESMVWAFLDRLEEEDAEHRTDLLPGTVWRQMGVPKSEAAKESFYATEDAYLREGTTYFYKVRAQLYEPGNLHHSGDDHGPEVFIWAAINTDLEYGRDYIAWAGGAQNGGGYAETIPLSEITAEKLAEVRSKLYDRLAEA